MIETVLLRSPGWPVILSIDQAGLDVVLILPSLRPGVLGTQECAPVPAGFGLAVVLQTEPTS